MTIEPIKPPVAKTAEELKADREAERAKIDNQNKEVLAKEDDTKEEEVKEEAEIENEEIEAKEEEVEDNKEEIKESEKTEDELKAEKAEAKTAAEKARIQKRIDREVSKRKVLEDELKDLKAQLAKKVEEGEEVLTKEDIDREAKKIAAQQVAEKEFVDACNKLAKEANKVDKEFDKKIEVLSDDIGPIPSQIIGILDDFDNGGAVLSYLANNVDEAEEIWGKSIARQSLALSKISIKLAEEAKPKPKPISKAPKPNEPLAGANRGLTTLSDKMDDKTWIDTRNRQVAEREAQRRTRGGR